MRARRADLLGAATDVAARGAGCRWPRATSGDAPGGRRLARARWRRGPATAARAQGGAAFPQHAGAVRELFSPLFPMSVPRAVAAELPTCPCMPRASTRLKGLLVLRRWSWQMVLPRFRGHQ